MLDVGTLLELMRAGPRDPSDSSDSTAPRWRADPGDAALDQASREASGPVGA